MSARVASSSNGIEASASARLTAYDRPADERLLTQARELVRGGWCRSGLAMDRDGRQVEPWSAEACSWSPLGALMAAWFGSAEGHEPFRVAYTALALATGGRLEEWNAARWRTQRHVLNAFIRAHVSLSQVRKSVGESSPRSSPSADEPSVAVGASDNY